MAENGRFTEELGALHQRHLEAEGLRASQGSFYTPVDVVERLLDLCLKPLLDELAGDAVAIAKLRVLDPACGSGNFLAGAARRIAAALTSAGLEHPEAVRLAFGDCIIGIDIDEAAVRLARQALTLEAGKIVGPADLESTIVAVDALSLEFDDGPLQLFESEESKNWLSLMNGWGCSEGFDLVVGNPPFLSQLARSTARSKGENQRSQIRFGTAVAKLTDASAIFLLLAQRLARISGVVCMIQPLSFLAARDADGVRRALLASGQLSDVWIAGERIFDAEVNVCAVVLSVGGAQKDVKLHVGRSFVEHASVKLRPGSESSWSQFLTAATEVPQRDLMTHGCVADVATATSDFRDFYYGIAPHVADQQIDEAASPRILTVGLIDVAVIRWGDQATRINKRRFERPCLNLAGLEPEVRRRAEELLVPKVVVATQTKTLEAAVDEFGRYVPSVPVVTIIPHALDLWRLLAVLNAPPVLLVALERHSGSGLGADVLRLSARDCLELPLPANEDAWVRAARLIEAVSRSEDDSQRVEQLREYASAACSAYGLPDDEALIAWWWERLPRGVRDTQERIGTA